MHFDLTDLRLYLDILEAGNITAGATRSHLSLAAASARLRALERSAGTAFFLRGRRGVSVTPAGQALARHARLILQQSEGLRQELADYAQGIKGQVRLLCNSAALSEYLPERLADFLREHPQVAIDLQERPSQRIALALRSGAAELGILSDAQDCTGLQTRPFCDDPLVVAIPLGHALAGNLAPRLSDTLAHELIGLSAHSALSIYLEAQALHLGLRLQPRVRADGFDGVLRMVARGAGLGIVPQASVERWPAPAGFTWRALDEPWARRRLLLCARDFAQLPAYARALFEALSSPQPAVRHGT